MNFRSLKYDKEWRTDTEEISDELLDHSREKQREADIMQRAQQRLTSQENTLEKQQQEIKWLNEWIDQIQKNTNEDVHDFEPAWNGGN